MDLSFTERLEQTQYNAALVVSRAWKGTRRPRILDELEWETLHNLRRYRKLIHFFSLSKFKAPDYLFQEFPNERITECDLRSTHKVCY